MLVGGVSCASRDAEAIHNKVLDIRSNSPFPGDSLQWKHLSNPRKIPTYCKLIDCFCELNDQHVIDFTCIIIDTSKLDHSTHNDGDGEAFFQKMMFSLVGAKADLYGRPTALRAFHGYRDSKFNLQEVRKIINFGIAKRRGRFIYNPLRQLEYMQVRDSGLHQITDVLLGCVAYHWNPRMRYGNGRPKDVVARHAHSMCPPDALGAPTPWRQRHFNIWQFQLEDPRA